MASPEQEAFIKEMQQTKPKDIWRELWEARQKLKVLEGVETPVDPVELTPQQARRYLKIPKVFRESQIVHVNGEWYPFPIHGDVPDLEYMRDGLGRVRFRMAQTE